MFRVTQISYGITVNLGNYESERLDMTVEFYEIPDEVALDQLHDIVHQEAARMKARRKSLRDQEDEGF